MRLTEFAPTNLIGFLNFVANRTVGDNKEIPIKVLSKMAQKMGLPLNYQNLKKAYDEDPNLQNLIADIDQDKIILKSPDEVDNDSLDNEENLVKKLTELKELHEKNFLLHNFIVNYFNCSCHTNIR